MSKKQSANGNEVVIGVGCEESTELKRSSSKGSESCTLEQIDVDLAVSVAIDLPSPEISKSSPNPGTLHMNTIHSPTRIRTLKRSDESRGDGDSPYAESFTRGWSEDEVDKEIYKKAISRYKHMKVKKKILTEWIIFLCSLGVLMASLTVKKLVNVMVWGLEFWKWCVLFMVIFNGMLVASLFMHFTVVVTEKNTLLRKKVLYFLLGIKKNVEVVIWLAFVLITWLCLFNSKIERSKTIHQDYVLCYMDSCLCSYWGIFMTLVRPREEAEKSQCLSFSTLRRGSTPRCLSFNRPKIGNARKKEEVIDMGKLQKMKPEEVSASTKEVLVDAVSSSEGLSTFSYTLDEMGKKEITNEMEAVAAAKHIFWNVAPRGERYIEERDFMEFMNKEELDLVWPLIDVANTGRLNRRALRAWVVKVFNGRKALNHALTDTKAAIMQLNNLVTSIVVVVSIVVDRVVFIIHPFDVGDRCVVDDVPLMVEKMNILTTVFLKLNNEMVYYPNSVLATKTISNYYRSSNMGDTVEFSIALTPVENIRKLKLKIRR
ncbi:hypothetical protein M0R45_009217 [Rubus argutus]|uniref:Mechanosensitive ion channel MscS domain-containing protein n=1 Tax=Rubus argutus TaxID=59490 RepID=A0AAW1Y3U6_RUBAR